jgi:uncharacterized protein YdaT
MPWDEDRYPASMSHLPVRVRRKAIEIANALLAEGYDEGKAIRIAIAKAKEWAARRVAALDPDAGGVVSAGGVGFDISCGVR